MPGCPSRRIAALALSALTLALAACAPATPEPAPVPTAPPPDHGRAPVAELTCAEAVLEYLRGSDRADALRAHMARC